MYKILIVDDEHLVRRGITSKLRNQGLDFEWVGEAANGEEALELMLVHRPQIVITDIKMPHMDGISLIRHAKELYPETRFIIVSGYAEFEYAEQALNMGVSGYILKPISDEQLAAAVKKVIAGVENDSRLKEMRDSLVGNNESLQFERRVNQVFASSDSLAVQDNDGKTFEGCQLVLIHIDSSTYSGTEYRFSDLDGIKQSVRDILSRMEFQGSVSVMDNYKDVTQIMVLLRAEHREDLKAAGDRFVVDAFSRIRRNLGIDVTMAVSGVEPAITADLMKQAMAAYDLRLAHGGNQIYKHSSVDIRKRIDFPEHKLKLLRNCLEMFDFKNIRIILQDIFTDEGAKKAPGLYARTVYAEIVNMLIRVCSQQNIDIEKSLDAEMVSGQVIDTFGSADDIVNYLYTTIIDIMKAEAFAPIDSKGVIGRIRNYIDQHYAEEIMVKDLAHKFAFNPNYLSTIFKQETGRPVSKYVEDIRIDRACQLLQNTRSSISDIAQSVGYADAQYFYRVFKKVVGVTPMDYRNKGKAVKS